MSEPVLIHKTHYSEVQDDNDSVRLPVAVAAGSAFSWEQLDELIDLMAETIVDLRLEWRAEIEAKARKLEQRIDDLYHTANLRSEVAELRGALTTLVDKAAAKTVEVTAQEVTRKVHTTSRKS
jgi:hypothetical protein